MSTIDLIARDQHGNPVNGKPIKSMALMCLGKNTVITKSGAPRKQSNQGRQLLRTQDTYELPAKPKPKQLYMTPPVREQPVSVLGNVLSVIKSNHPNDPKHPNVFEIDLTHIPEEKLTTFEGVKGLYEAVQRDTARMAPAIAHETQNPWFRDIYLVPTKIGTNVKIYNNFTAMSKEVMMENMDSEWRYPYSNRGTQNEGKLPVMVDDAMESSQFFRKVYFEGNPYRFS